MEQHISQNRKEKGNKIKIKIKERTRQDLGTAKKIINILTKHSLCTHNLIFQSYDFASNKSGSLNKKLNYLNLLVITFITFLVKHTELILS